eukprot:5205545-Karenia_brevis.AAC.1
MSKAWSVRIWTVSISTLCSTLCSTLFYPAFYPVLPCVLPCSALRSTLFYPVLPRSTMFYPTFYPVLPYVLPCIDVTVHVYLCYFSFSSVNHSSPPPCSIHCTSYSIASSLP